MKQLTLCAVALSVLTACDEPTRPALTRQLPDAPRLAVSVSGAIDLGTLGGTFSAAVGINAVGQVVGNSTTGVTGMRGFLWETGNPMINLGALGPGGLNFSQVVGVNDLGQVIGVSSN